VSTRKNYKERLETAVCNTVTNYVPMGIKTKDLKGQKFGRLTILEYLGLNNKRHAVWKCVCDCGNMTNSQSSSLIKGMKKSCGCLMIELSSQTKNFQRELLRPEIRGITNVYKNYQQGAKSRDIEFNLTLKDFEDNIFKNCHYCGREPQNVINMTHGRQLKYNGLDRIENEVGYQNNNILPCCIICNRMKMDMGINEFSSYITALVRHTKTWIKGFVF
jgi:hypothetical protein